MRDPIQAHDEYVTNIINKKILEGKGGTVYIPELLEKSVDLSRADKIKLLQKNATPALKMILLLCYDDTIQWIFTKKDLDGLVINRMDITDYDTAPASLFRIAPKLTIFTNKKSGAPLSKEKGLKVIGEWFSAMHPNDVALIKDIVNGSISYKGITKKLVVEAFPNLLPKKTVLPFEDDNLTVDKQPKLTGETPEG